MFLKYNKLYIRNMYITVLWIKLGILWIKSGKIGQFCAKTVLKVTQNTTKMF